MNKTLNLGLNKSPENNYDYLSHNYKELLDANWDTLDNILANRELNIKQFGALGDGKNYTKEIQSAIDSLPSEGGIVYVPAGLYLIDTWAEGSTAEFPLGGISLRNDTILNMAPGAIFKAMPSTHADYTIVRATGTKNIAILGGTYLGDRNEHIGNTGESGHGISIIGSSNVVVKDCTVLDCWGDGVFVGPNKELSTESTNVKLINVISNNNRRQGLNINGCIAGLIEQCGFNSSNGTSSEMGIKIEPFNSSRVVKDIVINNCFVTNNKGNGIHIGTKADGVTISGSFVRSNKIGIVSIMSNSNKFHNNSIEGNKFDGMSLTQSNYNIIESNYILKNNNHGIVLHGSSNNLVNSNMSIENGVQTDNSYDNIFLINGSSNNSIQSNVTRKSVSNTINSRYGMSILTNDCVGNFVVNNDLFDGGQTSEFYNNGNGTIDNGNRKDTIGYTISAKVVNVTDSKNVIDGINLDEAIEEIFDKLIAHVNKTIDSHDASSISIADPGNKTTKTNVEEVIQELYDEVVKSRTYAP